MRRSSIAGIHSSAMMLIMLVLAVHQSAGQGITDEDHIQRIKQNSLSIQTGVGFAVVNPQGSFRDALVAVGGPDVGLGVNLHLGYHLQHSPVWIVGAFTPTFMGGTYVTVPFDGGLFSSREITSQTMIMPFTVGVRIQPDVAHVLYPYAETFVGITAMSASATYRESRRNQSSERRENRVDAAVNYGVGVGLALNVADVVSLPNSLQRFTVDASMRYLRGGALDVVRGVVDATTTDFVWQRTASSNMVVFALGLTVQF